MKNIALIHDRLVFLWWADGVFFEMIKSEIQKYPNAKFRIFTLVSKQDHIEISGHKIPITTALPTRLNKRFIHRTYRKESVKNPIIKLRAKLRNYRNLIVFYPFCQRRQSRKIRKFNPERAIISSANISKNLSFPHTTYTKLYMHSALMYVQPEFKEFYSKFNLPTKILLSIITPRLRRRDSKFTKFDEVRANSKHTANIAKKVYNIEAKVAYPAIPNITEFMNQKPATNKKDYYIYVWRLVNSLRDVDKMILAFNQIKEKLIIIGSWSDETIHKKIAWPNIEFLWYIKDRKKIADYIKHSKWYINLAYESSGMSTVEALLLWVPIFGYNKWWTAELVDNKSWYLIDKKDTQSILSGFKKFESIKFDPIYIQNNIKALLKKQGRKTMT